MADLGWFQHHIKGHLFLPKTVTVKNLLDTINWIYRITTRPTSHVEQHLEVVRSTCAMTAAEENFFKNFGIIWFAVK